jgi:glycosyltransferase involved in cell wall biosynthesis
VIEAAARRLPIARRRIRPAVVIGAELGTASLGDARRRLLREERLGEGGTHLILTAGRLVPAKRHELFVSCTAELVRKHPGARFVIVGEGPLRQKLTGQIDELGLADVVSLLGTRSDLHELLQCTEVYVRPSLLEGGIGMTVLEAQAACVPVVSFDTQDVRAAITHGVTGWLVPLGDIARLADAVSSLHMPRPKPGRSSRPRTAKRWSDSTSSRSPDRS